MTAPAIHFEAPGVTLWHGDCIETMRLLPDATVDAVVTDPPYGLEFMGKEWDSFGADVRQRGDATFTKGDNRHGLVRSGLGASYGGDTGKSMRAFQQWCTEWAAECLRVLKPGGHLLAFGGSRTWHRLAAGVEDAGFEIRDSIAWLYGSGFPKSMDVAKAIDKRRDDSEAILAVCTRLAAARDRAGVTNLDMDQACGLTSGGASAGHWTAAATRSIRRVPTWDQWQALRSLLKSEEPDLDAEIWRLNGLKGTPGAAFSERPDAKYDSSVGMAQSWTEGKGWNGKASKGGAGVLPEAQQWQGWGTALKPAFEPIVVGRKPLAGTVAANVLAHGTGALNIDGTRIGDEQRVNAPAANKPGGASLNMSVLGMPVDAEGRPVSGRWPTNVLLDQSQAAALDAQTGVLTSGKMPAGTQKQGKASGILGEFKPQPTVNDTYGDSGGASRFFPTFRYEAKAGGAERPSVDGVQHPTVKPLVLMEWLIRLVTPPGGTVLEPFAGSGTTLEAAVREGFSVIGIEREASYLPLIVHRLAERDHQQSLFGDWDES